MYTSLMNCAMMEPHDQVCSEKPMILYEYTLNAYNVHIRCTRNVRLVTREYYSTLLVTLTVLLVVEAFEYVG